MVLLLFIDIKKKKKFTPKNLKFSENKDLWISKIIFGN